MDFSNSGDAYLAFCYARSYLAYHYARQLNEEDIKRFFAQVRHLTLVYLVSRKSGAWKSVFSGANASESKAETAVAAGHSSAKK